MMPGGGASSTSKAEIPAEAKPYLYGSSSTSGILPQASNIYETQSALGPYQDRQLATLNPMQDYGLASQANTGYNMSNIGNNAMKSMSSIGLNLLGGGGGQSKDFNSYKGNYQQNVNDILGMNYKNPHLEEMIRNTQDSASQAFNRNVMPQLQGQAIGAGQYGGSKDYIAQGLAAGDLSRYMTDTAANQYGNAYNQGYNAMTGLTSDMANRASNEGMANANNALQAQNISLNNRNLGLNVMNSLGQMGNLGLGGAQAMQGAGTPYQSQQQSIYDMGRENEINARQFQQGLLNNYQGTVIPGSGLGKSQTTEQDPGALGTIGTLGSLGLGAYALLSDRRLKKNIVKLGTRSDGLNVYQFDYLWDEGKHIGVMADEVEKVIPDAVIHLPSGYKAVNYAML